MNASRKRASVKSSPDVEDGNSEVVLYEAPGGEVHLDVRLDRDTVWLTQAQMADLFGRERSVVTKHVRNVFADGELAEESNVQNLHIANSDKPVAFYNLDVIISAGYRVKSVVTTPSAACRAISDYCLACSAYRLPWRSILHRCGISASLI